MTENKRFYVAESNLTEGYCIFDKKKQYSFGPRKKLKNCLSTCNVLNELYDENTQLKNKLKFFNELNKPYGSIVEENIRLKALIKELSNNCGEIVLMNGMGYNVDKILGDLKKRE